MSDPGPGRPSVGAARWSDRALALCALAGLIAAAAVTRTWARATLSDRGSALLVVTRSGWELRPTGPLVVAFGLLTGLICLLAHRSGRAALGVLLAVLGAAVAGLALSRLHAADPLVHKIGRLRIGTFQTDEPVAAGTAGAGLWAAALAGIVVVLAAVSWLLLTRRIVGATHASTAGGRFGPPAATGAGSSGVSGAGSAGVSGAGVSGAGPAVPGGIEGGSATERGVDHGL
ncbi:hypothetical protein [Frankia sp. QA3]|uniref:hypothetical protein n=1 Tax=Frankia sp. QA3 TaxID=710111 RepID=UPI00030AEC36|nr:hypothetical protein [Frankia sp. QA3]